MPSAACLQLMLHPFFNAPEYPLHRPDAAELLRCLTHACPEVARIELFYRQSQANLPALTTHQAAPQLVWSEALRHLTTHGALRAFCAVMRREYAQGRLAEQLDAVLEAQAEPAEVAVPDPVGILVLDRLELRTYLAELVLPGGQLKVILITGETRSGKSHSRHLFTHLAERHHATSLYLQAGMVATVDEVVQYLYSALGVCGGYPTQATSYTTEEAWYRAVCIDLMGHATERQRRLWIAVDDLGVDADGVPLMDQRIRDFFNHFVLHMTNPAFQQVFRLMLIDYPPGETPARWEGCVWRADQLTVAGITGQHVEQCLGAWARQRERTIFDQQIKELAASVMQEAQAQQQTQRLRCIAARVQHHLDTL